MIPSLLPDRWLSYRHIILVAVWIAIIGLLSLLFGGGYVMIVWLGWQIQTTVTLLLLLATALAYLLAYLARMMINSGLMGRLSEQWFGGRSSTPSANLHQPLSSLEQLGYLWLLDNSARSLNSPPATFTARPTIDHFFSADSVLKPIILAYQAREQGNFAQAAQHLQQATALPELVQIEQIRLSLAEQDPTKNNEVQALQQLNALEALVQQQGLIVEPSLADDTGADDTGLANNPNLTHSTHLADSAHEASRAHIPAALSAAIAQLWMSLALRQPLLLLDLATLPVLSDVQQQAWLKQLLAQLPQASPAQLVQLQQHYEHHTSQPDALAHNAHSSAYYKSWLMVLYRWPQQYLSPEMIERRQQLADQLLQREFDPEVLTVWLQDQVQRDDLNDGPDGDMKNSQFSQRVAALASLYPGQPSIALAQWHLLQASHQPEAAQLILGHWQQHADFSYLRLAMRLADQPEPLRDLNTIYQQHLSATPSKLSPLSD